MAGVHDLLLERMPCDGLLVDLDAESWLIRNLPEAILHADRSAHHLVIPGHRAGHFFLDHEVWRGDVEMQRRDPGQRTERIMWRDADPCRVSHGGNLARFR